MSCERRQLLMLVISPFAIIAFGWGVYALLTPPQRNLGARAKYDLIVKDMTVADVVRVMTVPDGDYSTGPLQYPSCGTGLPGEVYREGSGKWPLKAWTWDDGVVNVFFGADGVVASKSFTPAWPEPFFERVVRWIHVKRW